MSNNFFEKSEEYFGFTLKDKKIQFYAPSILVKGTENLNKKEELSLLNKYIFILKNYAYSKTDKISHFREYDDIKNFDIIEAYLNIINDYITNGDFSVYIKTNRINQKKINWNKTIKRNENIIFQKERDTDKILYGSFLSKDKEINNDDFFFKIYIETLEIAKSMFLQSKINIERNIYNEKECLYYINKYLDTHFKDREIYIAKQLKKIYSNSSISTIDDSLFPIKYHEKFEHIFQFLVECNIKEYSNMKNKENKNGYYFEKNSNKKKNGIFLKFDHYIENDGKHYIIDSKFYQNIDFESKENFFPKTSDIIKQIGYKLYISKIKNIDIQKITNVFIFPTEEKIPFPIFFAEHIVENDIDCYFEIKCVKVNLHDIIDKFIKKKTNTDLINIIQESSKK